MKNDIEIEFEVCANPQVEEMLAEDLVVANFYRNKVKIDSMVVDMRDIAYTFVKRMTDTKAYHYFAQKRAEKRKQLA